MQNQLIHNFLDTKSLHQFSVRTGPEKLTIQLDGGGSILLYFNKEQINSGYAFFTPCRTTASLSIEKETLEKILSHFTSLKQEKEQKLRETAEKWVHDCARFSELMGRCTAFQEQNSTHWDATFALEDGIVLKITHYVYHPDQNDVEVFFEEHPFPTIKVEKESFSPHLVKFVNTVKEVPPLVPVSQNTLKDLSGNTWYANGAFLSKNPVEGMSPIERGVVTWMATSKILQLFANRSFSE